MAAPDVNSITPLTLPRDMVRVVFPLNQSDPLPDISTLPGLVSRWNFASAAGTPVTVSYSFSGTAPLYDPGSNVSDPNSYVAYTDAEKANCANVLAAYQAVCGITFQFEADPANAQMVFRKANLVPSGFAYFPPHFSEQPVHGDAYFEAGIAEQPYIVFHELGHALGLGHAFDAGKPIPEDYGIPGGRHLSVVDQNLQPKPYHLLDSIGNRELIFHPSTPMPLDILALQMLYGQNLATNAGNTVYTYDVNPNFYQTIWDGGGKDTIDLSNQVNPNIVSLVDGSYSSIGLRDPWAGIQQSGVTFLTGLGLTVDDFNDGSNMLAIAFDCVIENARGGSAGDRLIGNAVNNQLYGNAGNDTLTGAGGNDSLDGGAGNDSLLGGAGKDTYVVNSAGDVVSEAGGSGIDTVKSTVAWKLGAGQENLVLIGGGVVNGTGNAAANSITGNGAANVLSGAAGNDTLAGGAGKDVLIGGTGLDRFQFTTAPNTTTNRDTIKDFLAADDTIALDDAIFAALGAPGALAPSKFHSGAGITSAGDADDFLIYNTTSGVLYYDANGSAVGAAIQVAVLTGAPALTAADFTVV